MSRSMPPSAAARKTATTTVCMTHDLWSNLNQRMYDYLDSVSLQALVMQQARQGSPDMTV
jgi:DNA-binding IscR family transcriptional regulator